MEYDKVNIPKPIMKRLKALQHKGQTIAGVIEELLDKIELSAKLANTPATGDAIDDG